MKGGGRGREGEWEGEKKERDEIGKKEKHQEQNTTARQASKQAARVYFIHTSLARPLDY